MRIEDLKSKWNEGYNNLVVIQHKDNKTVRFWPTGLDETETHLGLNGYWIVVQTGEPVVQEHIRINKGDLDNWNIV